MRTAVTVMAGLLTLPLLAGSALSQTEERYRLERTDDGYVRMDIETGAMTLCRESSGELICAPASEESRAAGSDIDTLRNRIDQLEARVDALENGESASTDNTLEQEFEQSLNLMERFFRRFVDIVRGIEQDVDPAPAPSEGASPSERT